jgi:hypothetical protein
MMVATCSDAANELPPQGVLTAVEDAPETSGQGVGSGGRTGVPPITTSDQSGQTGQPATGEHESGEHGHKKPKKAGKGGD